MQSRILLHSCHFVLEFRLDPLKLPRDPLKVVAGSPRNLLKILANGSPVSVTMSFDCKGNKKLNKYKNSHSNQLSSE